MTTTYPNPVLNSEPNVRTSFKADGYRRFTQDNLTIIDKNKKEVSFIPNPAQSSLLDVMQAHLLILILKARKMGFSSVALAVAVAKFILGENEKCVTMSFDQSAADRQLARAKHFIRSYEVHNNVKVPYKYNSRSEMAWEGVGSDGHTFTNTLRVGTAKSTSFGRGDDITYLHLTEVAFCNDIDTLLAGVGEAVVNNAHMILETTANGFNGYKTLWDDSMLNLKGFCNLFYGPEWEYGNDFLADKAKKLGRLFQQEYPRTPEEAFVATGTTYFDHLALARLLESVKLWEERQRVIQPVQTYAS